ncbi:helix-turn-helix domain-containing protein [Kitasatospora sp. NPDC094011]|uniref:helix-turn-helix domain-containing protein n=1 Tax=Kitasatospora sp. NPDC094011 TaxID=3364090 RepID=UPI0038075936
MRVGVQGDSWDEGLSGRDRFEYWRDALAKTRECETTSAHVESFEAELRRSELGAVTIFWTSFRSARFERSERMVRCSDRPPVYHLTLLTSGAQALRRGRDQRDRTGPGELTLMDNTTPYDVRVFGTGPGGARAEGVGIDIPQELLPLPGKLVGELLGRRLSAQAGSGPLLAEFLLGLNRQAHVLEPAEASRLGTVVVDLVAAWAARELNAGCVLPREARWRALLESVRAFVRHNLHDPDLTPAVVAAAHHISLSHLHHLFTRHSGGETLAASIRRQRLQRAHRDLADPALRGAPVHVVAAACGLPRASEFSRAFKAAYGISPREHRSQALLKAT